MSKEDKKDIAVGAIIAITLLSGGIYIFLRLVETLLRFD